MDDIDNGMLEAQEHYLRGASAVNNSYAPIAGKQLRTGNPEVINQYRKNLQKIDKYSSDISKKRESLQTTPAEMEKINRN